ncbi:unnamed protein product [Sphagnum tenellum]
MSAFSMKPQFSDLTGYKKWRHQWRVIQKEVSTDIRRAKYKVKAAQREGTGGALQKQLHIQRAMGFKLMGLLQEAKERWARLLAVRQQIAEQMASFPLTMEDCRMIDFHYNKGSDQNPDLPRWVVKTKGKTFYVKHITANCPWSTRETPEGSTKGMLRFRNCNLHINAEGEAIISVDRTEETG